MIRAAPPAAVATLVHGLKGRERHVAELARIGPDPEADLGRVFESPQRPEIVAEVFAQLAERIGGPAALAWAETLPTAFHRASARLAVASTWARIDAKSALAWAMQLPAADEQLQQSVLHRTALNDPVRVVEAIGPRWPELSPSLVHALQRWSELDLPAVLAWVRGRPNPVERRAATFGLLKAWIQRDGPAALSEATRLEFVGRDRESLVDRGAGHWLRIDAAAASRWFNGLAPGQLRNNALGGMVRAINHLEAGRRLPLLEGLKISAEDLPTVRYVVFGLAHDSLEPTLQWALARGDRALAAAFVSCLADYAGSNRRPSDGLVILQRWFAQPNADRDPSDTPLIPTAARLLQATARKDRPWPHCRRSKPRENPSKI